jgi:hypothetical protein
MLLLAALSPPTDVAGPPLLLDKDQDWRDALLALVHRLHDPDGSARQRMAVDAALRAAQAEAYGN